MIYESERAGFMADHKSVSAQLTLGNFPTLFSNQTPLPWLATLPRETHRGRWGGPGDSGSTGGSPSAPVDASRRASGKGPGTWREDAAKIRNGQPLPPPWNPAPQCSGGTPAEPRLCRGVAGFDCCPDTKRRLVLNSACCRCEPCSRLQPGQLLTKSWPQIH